MARLNTNNAYLSFDGYVYNAVWTDDIGHEVSAETEDVTAGSGQEWMQRETGLKDASFDFVVVHETTSHDADKAKLEQGLKGILVYGPRGNAAGMPKFEQEMILETVSTGQSISKTKVVYELSFVGADTPVSTLTGTLAETF